MQKEIRFQEVYALSKQNRFQEALNLVYDAKSKSINKDYKHDENHAWYLVADLFYKMGAIEDAKLAFMEAIKVWSEDIDAYIGLSNILNQQEKYEEASRIYKKALSFSDDNRLIYNYANNLFDQKLLNEAIHEYKKIPKKSHQIYELAVKNIKKAEKILQSKNNSHKCR